MDIILYNIIIGFVSLFIGYIFGSIPTGVIIGKLFFHKDPRTEGSKNSGGTNVGRLFGKKVGVICILLDMLKTAIPTVGVWAILTFTPLNNFVIQNTQNEIWDFLQFFILLAPFGATLGHCWPIFAGFKGGKAVSAFAGFGISTCWVLVIAGVTTFFSTLKAKKFVSLASIITAVVASVGAWVLAILKIYVPLNEIDIVMWGAGSFTKVGIEYASIMSVIAIILIIRHKPNIVRLAKGEENKIKWMK